MQVRVPDQAVCIDERLCHLILDNALSNAFKHGHCDNPDVQLAIELSQAATATSPDTMLLTATVTNVRTRAPAHHHAGVRHAGARGWVREGEGRGGCPAVRKPA